MKSSESVPKSSTLKIVVEAGMTRDALCRVEFAAVAQAARDDVETTDGASLPSASSPILQVLDPARKEEVGSYVRSRPCGKVRL